MNMNNDKWKSYHSKSLKDSFSLATQKRNPERLKQFFCVFSRSKCNRSNICFKWILCNTIFIIYALNIWEFYAKYFLNYLTISKPVELEPQILTSLQCTPNLHLATESSLPSSGILTSLLTPLFQSLVQLALFWRCKALAGVNCHSGAI